VNDAVELYSNSKSMFNDAKMNLREWMTNNEEVKSKIPTHDRASESSPKVLGHVWNVQKDSISLQKAALVNKDHTTTKRNVLRQLASVFDPMGLLSPVTLQGKILLQSLWKKRLEWDETMDAKDIEEWLNIKEDLKNIDSVDLPRCISIPCDKGTIKYTFVCFCDASNKAYAASVYLVQVSEQSSRCDLIFSKSRLAPVKTMTIPRLELMAVLIGVRCIKYVVSQMKLSFEKIVLMSDSQCVLQWISSKKVQPVFIENRLKEIRGHDDVTFEYVNTKENPADIASRGCSLETLREHRLWWHGPHWIVFPYDRWPNVCQRGLTSDGSPEPDIGSTDETTQTVPTIDKSMKCEAAMTVKSSDLQVEEPQPPFGIIDENYSSIRRLFRVTAWCQRFVKRLKGQKIEMKCLTSKELVEAENRWLLFIQRKHFREVLDSVASKKSNNLARQLDLSIDNQGLLRCGGRLDNAVLAEAARHPILLPKKENLTNLYIQDIHERVLHSGISQSLSNLRQRFWIPHGRATVKKVLKGCKVCVKVEGGPYKLPNMAPLPSSRVSVSTPFSRIGLDYLGPLCVKNNGELQKVWVCLFTCLVTRAVHLELVQDMSASTFLYCLRRFIATRGTPVQIISDNAKQFKLSSDTVQLVWQEVTHNEEVQNYVSCEGITWSFIVELAPWMGGFYERLVGLVKQALRKTIGRKRLTLDQMSTVLKEAEAVVNSRPLVYMGDDLKSSIAITPRHFTCLNPYTGIPDVEDETGEDSDSNPYESSAQQLLQVWRKGERLLNTFWQIWRKEYLLSLRERSQMKVKSSRVVSHSVPCIGDVVLIKDDIPRGQWEMGKLVKLTISKDRQVRSAEVQTSTGKVLRRPLNLLFPIETAESYPEEKSQPVPEKKDNDQSAVKMVNHGARPKRQAATEAKIRLQNMI